MGAAPQHITAELRQSLSLGYARLRQSLRASVDGRLDESERLAAEAYEYTRTSGPPDARAFWVGQRFNIRFHQGRLGEVTEELAAAADDYPGIVAFRAAVAMVSAELQQPDPARHALNAIFGPGGTGIPDDLNCLVSVAFATQAAAQLNDAELCDALYRKLIPYRDQFVDNASTFWGSVEGYLALAASCMGRTDDARVSYQRAVDSHTRLNAPILLARTRVEWAEATVRAELSSTSRSFAVGEFRAALGIAERLELRTIARRAREGLAELGC